MEVKEFQKLCAGMVGKIDRKVGVKRDGHLNMSQLFEELGELARVVNYERLRNRIPQKGELEGEFADVFLQLAKLAEILKVDIEDAVLEKVEVLKKRHGV